MGGTIFSIWEGGGGRGGVALSRQHVKIFILQLGKGLIEQNG